MNTPRYSLTSFAYHQTRLLPVLCLLLFSLLPVSLLAQTLYVPVRWCGIQGAPAMVDPGVVHEHTTDDVLWRRHERPTDAIYMDMVDMSFRAGATRAIKNGPQSFPIIRDPMGTGGNIGSTGEAADAAILCRRVWQMGDPLYYDSNNNGVANDGIDTLLSVNTPMVGMLELGHDGAPLVAAPNDVRYVDANGNEQFDIGEHLYRDENVDGDVDVGDTLLCPDTDGTVEGHIDAFDFGLTLRRVPAQVKYVDLILEPPGTYNIGYPQVQGVTAVSANDLNIPSISFPVHGIAALGRGGDAALCDDPSQYLPPGPDYTLFETQMIAHEFGHAFELHHGNEIDRIDDTTCTEDNVMQYCWQELGVAGAPDLRWAGVGEPSSGVFNDTQVDIMRAHVQRTILGGSGSMGVHPLIAACTDALGDVPTGFSHVDLTDYSVTVDGAQEIVEFVSATRRPFPSGVGSLRFAMILDVDGKADTGGAAQALQLPTDFAGAEGVITVDMASPTVLDTSFYRYDPSQNQFRKIPTNIFARRERIDAIVDFPGGGFVTLPIREEVHVFMPLQALGQAFAHRFRVEFISAQPQANVVDRARSQGMNFDPPVFPQCTLDPDVVAPGETTVVKATGLIPLRHAHVFLGDQQLTEGMTDSNGVVTINLAIPKETRTGHRLVTVGTGAVTADGSLLVEDAIRITSFTYQRANAQATIRWVSRLNGPFALEVSTDLKNFTTVITGIQSPYTFTLPIMPKRFFRIRSQ